MKVLGLDLGSNSIGWALINENTQEIIDMGVRIFQEGVDNYGQGGKEVSKNEARRAARGARRLKFRRKLRKTRLKSILTSIAGYNFWPESPEAYELFRTLNPYQLREKGTSEKLEPLELSRIWLQMAHRRGYRSVGTDSEAKTLYSGGDLNGVNIIGISTTEAEWDKSGLPTIGAYLASIQHIPGSNEYNKIRARYTLRKWFKDEFNYLWEVQKQFYPDLLNDDLQVKLRDEAIFFQRPLRPVSDDVKGKCEVFPDELRESAGHPAVQFFNLLTVLNNFKFYHKNTPDDKKPIPLHHHELLVRKFMWKADFTAEQILKAMKLSGGENGEYRTNFDHEKKIKACPFMGMLTKKEISGISGVKVENWQLDKIEELYNDIVSDKIEIETKINLLETKYGFNKDAALNLISYNPGKKYSSVSLKGVKALIPFMKGGGIEADEVIYDKPMRYDEAYKLATGKEHNRYDELAGRSGNKMFLPPAPDLRNPVVNRTLSELRAVVNCLINHYGKPDKVNIEMGRDITKNADDRFSITLKNKKNREENEQAAETIQTELNGDIVPSRGKQLRYRLWIDQDRRCIYTGENISIKDLFDSGKVDVDHIYPKSLYHDDSFQNKVVCFRTANASKGQQTPKDWLASNPEQYRRVLQNAEAFKNKYPAKYKRFELNPGEGDAGGADGFIERQLNDTRYATRMARKYLSAIVKYENIFGTKGAYTSVLRKAWLDKKDEPLIINPILDPYLPWVITEDPNHPKLHKDEIKGGKSRLDHRHHAVDALIVALCNNEMMKQLNRLQQKITVDKNGRKVDYISYKLPPKWDNLYAQAKEKVNRIIISHRVETKTNGQLHNETYYGKIKLPPSPKDANNNLDLVPPADREVAVVRKKLKALSKGEVTNIIDHQVRNIVYAYILEKKPDWTPGADFGKILAECPGLNNKNGNPIQKVRIASNNPSLILIREKKAPVYVDPQSNHHALLYVNSETGKVRGEIVQTYVVARNFNGKKIGFKPNPQPAANEEFLFSLKANELVYINEGNPVPLNLLSGKEYYTDLAEYVFRVQNLDFSRARAVYRQQWLAKIELQLSDSIKIKDCGRRIIAFSTEKIYKISIDPAGFLTLAKE